MSLLLLKLILTPLLIAAATLAARRWGPGVGGWLAGLPLTSGPVSAFFAVEQGPTFAARAAQGTLLGLVAVAGFCVAYARAARHAAWPISAAAGLGLYLLVTCILSLVSPSLAATSLLTAFLLCIAVIAIGRPVAAAAPVTAPWWDLPVRMTTATGIVVFLTGAASSLGPAWSGLLSPFPVFAGVMAVFAHRQGGVGAALPLLRGVSVGGFASLSFLIVIALLVERAGLLMVYSLAIGVAIAVNGVSLRLLLLGRAHHSAESHRGRL